MAKLHEILAVADGLTATARKLNDEAIGTFAKRDEHFTGVTRSVRHFADEDKKLDTDETKDIVTTVIEKLRYLVSPNSRAYDAYITKEATNQQAVADLVVGEATLATGVPGIVLLGLEGRLAELRAVLEAIPTLQPGPVWERDASAAKTGVYKARDPDVTFKTRKTIRPLEMSPATKEHPAQVQGLSIDESIARIETHRWSGMVSPAEKSELLARLDRLIRGVKRARQRANQQEVDKRAIGGVIFDFLFAGIVT